VNVAVAHPFRMDAHQRFFEKISYTSLPKTWIPAMMTVGKMMPRYQSWGIADKSAFPSVASPMYAHVVRRMSPATTEPMYSRLLCADGLTGGVSAMCGVVTMYVGRV